jgi:ribosomal protein L37E
VPRHPKGVATMHCADLPMLDIRILLHQGLLRDSTPGTLSLGELMFDCRAPDRSALLVSWNGRQQALPLRWTGVRGRPGAHRVCWRCPKCGKPTSLLYLLETFACAKCHGLRSGFGAAERLRRAKASLALLEAAAQGPIALLAELASRSIVQPSGAAVLVTGPIAPIVEVAGRRDAESRASLQQAQREQRLAAIRRAKREQRP